jgi:hypothetical protein
VTNALAYSASAQVTKKKSFIMMVPGPVRSSFEEPNFLKEAEKLKYGKI